MNRPRKYRKLPVIVEMIQWTGHNEDAVAAFVLQRGDRRGFRMLDGTYSSQEWSAELWVAANKQWLPVETGEWIAKDSKGFYPIKDDVQAASYEPVE